MLQDQKLGMEITKLNFAVHWELSKWFSFLNSPYIKEGRRGKMRVRETEDRGLKSSEATALTPEHILHFTTQFKAIIL